MIASKNQMDSMNSFLKNTGLTLRDGITIAKFEMIGFRDPSDAPDPVPVGHKPPHAKAPSFQSSAEEWLKRHTTDSRGDANLQGPVEVCVLLLPPENSHGGGDESPYLDPVDEKCSGLVDWATEKLGLPL